MSYIPDFILTQEAQLWLQREADLLANEGQEAVNVMIANRQSYCATYGGQYKNFAQLLEDKIEKLRT